MVNNVSVHNFIGGELLFFFFFWQIIITSFEFLKNDTSFILFLKMTLPFKKYKAECHFFKIGEIKCHFLNSQGRLL